MPTADRRKLESVMFACGVLGLTICIVGASLLLPFPMSAISIVAAAAIYMPMLIKQEMAIRKHRSSFLSTEIQAKIAGCYQLLEVLAGESRYLEYYLGRHQDPTGHRAALAHIQERRMSYDGFADPQSLHRLRQLLAEAQKRHHALQALVDDMCRANTNCQARIRESVDRIRNVGGRAYGVIDEMRITGIRTDGEDIRARLVELLQRKDDLIHQPISSSPCHFVYLHLDLKEIEKQVTALRDEAMKLHLGDLAPKRAWKDTGLQPAEH